MTAPHPADIRFRVDPADVPPEKAARRLHLTLERFQQLLPNLLARGFPAADPDTGMFDLDAIDQWRKYRHLGARELTVPPAPAPLTKPSPADMTERFRAAKERQTSKIRRRNGGAS